MEEMLCRIPGQFTCEELVRGNLDEGGKDWAWETIDLPEVWRKSKGEGVKVCVVDTGYDQSHPDFSGQVDEDVDFTGSGVQDRNSHGTWCASCIAGVAENGYAVGLAPSSRLYIAKALDDRGSGRTSWIAMAIRWAADNKCRVLSLSLGSPAESREITESIKDYYAEVPDGIVLAAAGNDGERRGHPMGYPAKLPNVIAVGAMNKNGTRASFSSWYDDELDVLAPGENVVAAIPMDRGGLGKMSGSSMGTPWAAGGACLWAAVNPGKGVSAFRKALQETSRDLGSPGYDSEHGWGMVDPRRLLQGEIDSPASTPGKTYKILSGEVVVA